MPRYFTFTCSRVVKGEDELEARINLENELGDNEPEWDVTDTWEDDE